MELRLSETEISELIAIHKELRSKRDADKLKCIIYWGKGYSWEEIKQLLFISDGTIKNYVDRYQVGKIKALLEVHYEGNNHKLSAEQIEGLVNYVDKWLLFLKRLKSFTHITVISI